MKKWTENLSNEVCERLANCKTRKEDLSELLKAKWLSYKESGKDRQGYTKEDALISVLELLDCNGVNLELTMAEYADLCY